MQNKELPGGLRIEGSSLCQYRRSWPLSSIKRVWIEPEEEPPKGRDFAVAILSILAGATAATALNGFRDGEIGKQALLLMLVLAVWFLVLLILAKHFEISRRITARLGLSRRAAWVSSGEREKVYVLLETRGYDDPTPEPIFSTPNRAEAERVRRAIASAIGAQEPNQEVASPLGSLSSPQQSFMLAPLHVRGAGLVALLAPVGLLAWLGAQAYTRANLPRPALCEQASASPQDLETAIERLTALWELGIGPVEWAEHFIAQRAERSPAYILTIDTVEKDERTVQYFDGLVEVVQSLPIGRELLSCSSAAANLRDIRREIGVSTNEASDLVVGGDSPVNFGFDPDVDVADGVARVVAWSRRIQLDDERRPDEQILHLIAALRFACAEDELLQHSDKHPFMMWRRLPLNRGFGAPDTTRAHDPQVQASERLRTRLFLQARHDQLLAFDQLLERGYTGHCEHRELAAQVETTRQGWGTREFVDRFLDDMAGVEIHEVAVRDPLQPENLNPELARDLAEHGILPPE